MKTIRLKVKPEAYPWLAAAAVEVNQRPCKRGNIAPRRPGNGACLCDACVAHAKARGAEYRLSKAHDAAWVDRRRAANRERMARKLTDPAYRLARNSQNRKWHATDPRFRMIYSARDRAKELGVPFSLTADDIAVPDRCPALGIELRTGSGRLTDHSPTLDRIIPALGYVRGNVIVISHKANRIKSNATAEELQAVAEWARNILAVARHTPSVSGNEVQP